MFMALTSFNLSSDYDQILSSLAAPLWEDASIKLLCISIDAVGAW